MQKVVRHIFHNIWRGNITLYIDDLYIYCKDLNEINEALEQVLRTAEAHSLLFNFEKSTFGQTDINCLGLLVSHGTVRPNLDKVKALLSIPQPETLKQLCSWLTAVNFYCNFIKDIAITLAPLYDALRGNPR